MGFIIGLLVSLAIVGLVIAGFIAYWIVMIMFFILVAIFLFWATVFALIFGDPYVGSLCSVFATGITLWLFSLRGEKQGG